MNQEKLDQEKLDNFLRNLKEKKENKFYKIFVEIGPGGLALPTQGKFFEDNEIYISIDTNFTDLNVSKNLSLTFKKIAESKKIFKNKNIFFIIGDANNLPFENNFVDEIFFGNIFGDGRLNLKAKENFLKEANRVVKENGILIIKETITPFSFDLLEEMLKKFNFKKDKKINYDDKEFSSEIRKYESKFFSCSFNSYIAYFIKNKK